MADPNLTTDRTTNHTAAPATHSLADPNATTGDNIAIPLTPPASSDRYRIGDEIAHGGMGVAYRATDSALGREVAVSVESGCRPPNGPSGTNSGRR